VTSGKKPGGSAKSKAAQSVAAKAAARTPAQAPAPLGQSATFGMSGTERVIWICLNLLVFLVPVAMSNFNWIGKVVSGGAMLPLTYDQFDICKVFIMRAAAIGGLAAWSFQFFFKGGKLRRTKLDWLIVGFLAWVLLTSFTSISPATALFGKYRRFEGFFSFLTYAVVYFLIVQVVDRPSRIRALARMLMFSSFIVAGYGVLQYLGLDPISWGSNLPFEANRAFSTFGNPDLLGGFLVFPLVISVALIFSEKNTWWRVFYWVTFLTTFGAWFTAYVRGAWIGGAFGLAVLVVALILAKAPITKVDWGFAGVTGLAGVGLFIRSMANSNEVLNIGTRLASILKFSEGSALTRFEIWQAAYGAIKARPLFGFGADTFRLVFPKYKPLAYVKDAGYLSVADNVHNYPLQLMAGIGIIGFLILYGLFGFALWISAPTAFARGKGTDRLVVAGFWAAAIGYILCLMTGLSVTGSTIFLWLSLAIIVSPTATETEHAAPSWGAIVGTLTLAALALAFIGNTVFIVADNFFLRGQFPATGEDPIALTKTAIALNPYNDIYRSMLGKAYENQIAAWMQQANTDQSAGKDPAADLAQAKLAFTNAERTYKETIAIVPTEYDNYLFLSALYNQAGSYFDPTYFASALKIANEGIAVEPFGPGVRLQKAVAQASTGDLQGALATSIAARSMDPNYTDPILFSAQILTRLGRLQEAVVQYKVLLTLQPTNTGWSDALKAVETSLAAGATGTTKP
jgi:putative inorganic carbon (HCO3(-)) transporter